MGIVGHGGDPSGWRNVNGYLVGPTADLTGSDLTNADLRYYTNLSGAILTGVSGGGIQVDSTLVAGGHQIPGQREGLHMAAIYTP